MQPATGGVGCKRKRSPSTEAESLCVRVQIGGDCQRLAGSHGPGLVGVFNGGIIDRQVLRGGGHVNAGQPGLNVINTAAERDRAAGVGDHEALPDSVTAEGGSVRAGNGAVPCGDVARDGGYAANPTGSQLDIGRVVGLGNDRRVCRTGQSKCRKQCTQICYSSHFTPPKKKRKVSNRCHRSTLFRTSYVSHLTPPKGKKNATTRFL